MAALLALSSALVYGAADFCGGLAARRISALTVVAASQMAGLALLLAVVGVFAGELTAAAFVAGAVAGVAGGIGVVLFYRGLAVGPMSVVAPVTAVVGAAVPVVVGLGLGERPGPFALSGIALALVAVALVAREEAPPGAPRPTRRPPRGARRPGSGLLLALGAGAGFGAFFVLLDRVPPDSGLWPLVGARSGSLALVGLALLVRGRALVPPRAVGGQILAAGIGDSLANVLYLLAAQRGLLSLVAVLTSLYPASTVLLARVVLGERLGPVQRTGLGAAVVAVALVALG